jgi:Tat protein secretion system quality control protein TatD with DNase activity
MPHGKRTTRALSDSRFIIKRSRCGIKPTHASFKHVQTRPPVIKVEKYSPGDAAMVKDRNEPCGVVQVVEAIAGIKGVGIKEVADKVYLNAFAALRIKMPE